MYSTAIDGTIPSTISALQRLQYVVACCHNSQPRRSANVLLCCCVVVSLFVFVVRDLMLNSNRLTGTLPQSLWQLTTLTFLDLSNNAFLGALPLNLSRLVNLQWLNLYNTSLSSTVPSGTLVVARVCAR